MSLRTLLPLAVLAGGCSAGSRTDLEANAPVPVRLVQDAVCYSCFWRYQDPALRRERIEVLGTRAPADPVQRAELRLIVARTAEDSAEVCAARSDYDAIAATETALRRRLLAEETVAFMAAECGADPVHAFRRAAVTARLLGEAWKASVYESLAAGSFRPRWAPTPIVRTAPPPNGTRTYVLGASAIRIGAPRTAVVQVERVARDWLSYQHAYDFSGTIARDAILDYHEGGRLRELMATTDLNVVPATGVLAIHVDDHWYAADGEGVFRFQVLSDKLQYATTRAWQGVALLVDTHGIASLVEPARRLGARLVVGCGDDIGKMQAAFFLAAHGVDVYYPTDDYAADVLLYDAPGVLIGSAPSRTEAGVTVIGDRPVEFRVDEPVIVESAESLRAGPLRYYHAPAKYFARLAELLPLNVEYVDVDGAGQADRIVARARERGARAIGVRVWNDADYSPVRDWLAASPDHRAVLLHSVVYPPGARLFAEFPEQTTFADARPIFN